MTFRGTYDHSLDAKHRLTVPSKFRASLSDGVVLAEGFEGCIAVWTPETFQAFFDDAVGDEPRLSARRRAFERKLLGGSHDTELDSAGRIGLPPRLREHAGLKKDCIVLGARDHLEIWDPEAYEAYETRVTASELGDLFG